MNTYNNNMQGFKPRKITNSDIKEALQNYVAVKYKRPVTEIEVIEEVPNELRHSCPMCGITILKQEKYNFNTGFNIITIPYFICIACGKLYIHKGV